MPVQKTDRNTTWFIDQADKTWVLAKTATITVDDQYGIYESVDGSEIILAGDVITTGPTSGVYVNGSDSSLKIARSGLIDGTGAQVALFSAGVGTDITNRGTIRGGDLAVYGNFRADVKNYGTIKSDLDAMVFAGEGSQIYNYGLISGGGMGISTQADGTYLLNARDATISGRAIGVMVRDSGDMLLVNQGTIRSDAVAIESEFDNIGIRNTGRIIGDVALGGGEDTLDTRGGTIRGKVYGGEGNDTLITSSAKIKLQEEALIGTQDRVISTTSYKLSANVEQLTLYGKKDIDGTGNAGDNWITGNGGDNILHGKGGIDLLSGGAGDDTLYGGGGTDVFFFEIGNDIERIKDFTDGEDLLGIVGVKTFVDFANLNIKQVKDDVVINLGGGDKLIIENTSTADITFDDIYVF